MKILKRMFLMMGIAYAGFMVGCSKVEPAALPVACFEVVNSTALMAGQSVNFTNCSQNAIRYSWDFGNGQTSIAKTPGIIYDTPGNYTIYYVCYNVDGENDSDWMYIEVK